MKIISKFYDYYDSIGKSDQSDYPLYIRHTRDQSTKQLPISNVLNAMSILPQVKYGDAGIVFFCGKAYPFIEYNTYKFHTIPSLTKYITNEIANVSKDDLWSLRSLKEHIQYFKYSNQGKKSPYWLRHPKYSIATWDYCVSTCRSLDIEPNIFRILQAPVFVQLNSRTTKDTLIVNPLLKEYNFVTVVDPYTAYQELSMYLGNILVEQKNPNVHISDELKAQSKGFDKWSFKKRPTKGKIV